MDYNVLSRNDYTPKELFGSGAKYFHFLSDARQIVDDYENANIKLLTRAEPYQYNTIVGTPQIRSP